MSAREQALPAALESAAWELAKMAYRAGYRDGEDALSGGWNALLKEWRDAPAAAWPAVRRELLAEARGDILDELRTLVGELRKTGPRHVYERLRKAVGWEVSDD